MVTLLLDSTQLEIVLSPVERALAFRRAPLRIERDHIAKVQLTDDAWTWLRGVADRGTHVAGVVAMGTWRSAGHLDFVVVRRRRPAVVIDLTGESEFDRVVLTTRHGLELVQALRLPAESALTEVTEIVETAPQPVVSGRRARPKPRPVPRPSPATA